MSAVLEIPDELAARIASRPDGKDIALSVLQEAFDDEEPEADHELMDDLRIGWEQIKRGETVSLDEARTYLKNYLDTRFGQSGK